MFVLASSNFDNCVWCMYQFGSFQLAKTLQWMDNLPRYCLLGVVNVRDSVTASACNTVCDVRTF